MKSAVYARHHLAAAHADYCRSLRITGSALSSFAAGEPLSVSDQTPSVFLHPQPSNRVSPRVTSSPPPPRLLKLEQAPPIVSNRRRKQKRKPKVPLPHILSESSSPVSERSNLYRNSTYSATPSHASSVWNWENFCPPSPPDSEFFDRKAKQNPDNPFFDTETERSEYDFFDSSKKKKKKQFESVNSTMYEEEEEEETEREEVQCSEWDVDDHYTTTSSSSEEEEEDDNMESVSEIETRSVGSSNSMSHQEPPPMPQEYGIGGGVRYHDKTDDASSDRGGGGEMEMVVRHRDLKEIADALKENFDKAAAAGDQVSQML